MAEHRPAFRNHRILPFLPEPRVPQDCRRKDVVVVSTFNEANDGGDRPALLIPGHPPSLKDASLPVTLEALPGPVTFADMPPNSFDSLVRSINRHYWVMLATVPRVIVTDTSTLAHLFRKLENRRGDLRLNLQPVGDMLFMRCPDPFADKTHNSYARAAAAIVASSMFEHCALARSFKRVVCYSLGDLILVVEDDSVATIDKTECVAEEDGEYVLLDAHTPGAMPHRGHRGEPDPLTLGDPESEPADVHLRLRHVRVAVSTQAARECDPGLYFSGALETQTFWVSGRPLGKRSVLKNEPGLLRKDIEQWEEQEDGMLRVMACFLTRLRESACGEAARSPWAKKFVCEWRLGWSTVRLWYGEPEADGAVIQFSRFPYLLSEDIRQLLEEVIISARQELNVRWGLRAH